MRFRVIRGNIGHFAACVFMLGVSAALARSGTPAPASDQSGAIEGTVVSATTNEPVEGARVLAVKESAATGVTFSLPVTTDAFGHFVIAGLSEGRYRLEAHADNFVTQAYGAAGPQAPGKLIELKPAEHISNLALRIFPCGVIAGTVRDENAKPVVGGIVQALSGSDVRYFKSTTTNNKGEYQVSGLDPGAYILQVSFRRPTAGDEPRLLPGGIESIEQSPDTNKGDKRPTGEKIYPCTFYPNVTDPGMASSVAVQPGAILPNIDVELHPANMLQVRGRLVNEESGKPAPSGLVGLNPRTSNWGLPARGAANLAAALCSNVTVQVSDPSGRFEIRNVPSGSYWAQGQIQEDERTLTGRVTVEVVDADVDDVIVRAGDGVDLKGLVRVEPSASFDFSRLRVSLGLLELGLPWLSVQPKTDGAFRFSGVAPGTYRLTASGLPVGYYLKSARLGGADVLDAGVSLDSTNPGRLDIVLASPGGTISGEVRKGDQTVPAVVYVAPEPLRLNRPDLFLSNPTNGDGTFTFAGVPPGNYRLFAFGEPDPNLVSNPVLFQLYEPNSESISVDDGTSQSVQVELISASAQE